MSLMEVLGASFTNLQLAQQSSSLAQANMNSSHPNVPSSYAANFFPQPSTLPVQPNISVAPQRQAPSSGSNNPQFNQNPACMSVDQPARHSSGKFSPTGCHHHTTVNLPSTANDAAVNYQVLLKCLFKLWQILLWCKQYSNHSETKLSTIWFFFFRKCSHCLSRRCHQISSLRRAGG